MSDRDDAHPTGVGNRSARAGPIGDARFSEVVSRIENYAIFMLDAEGRIASWNAGAEKLKLYRADEIIGDHFSRFYPEEDIAAGKPAHELRAAAATGRFEDFGWRLRKDGSRFWADVVITAYRDPAGTLLGFVKVTRDITDRRAIESHLRQTQKMEAIGQLAGGIAHDFNNILSIIMGNLELAVDLCRSDPEQESLIEVALKATQRGASLTHRLLAYSRQQQLTPTAVEVGKVVANLITVLRRVVEASIDIQTDIAADLRLARIDPDQLEDALLNLVINARDAMPDGGTLTITAENAELDEHYCRKFGDVAVGCYVQVSVGDTGTGMPREVLARALEPFYTTKPVGKGSGLGLSMVYGFVKQSGGHMTIYSEPGVGTTVRLYLPLTAPVIGHSASNEAPLPVIVTGDPVVLVIEDDDAVRTLQIRMLTQLGYQALEAADGTAGLDILRKGTKVDLLLSDVILPGGMNGPAFCATAQQSHPGLKVIYMSGYAPKAVTERYDLSGSQILTKPFTRAALAHALRHAFDTENTKD